MYAQCILCINIYIYKNYTHEKSQIPPVLAENISYYTTRRCPQFCTWVSNWHQPVRYVSVYCKSIYCKSIYCICIYIYILWTSLNTKKYFDFDCQLNYDILVYPTVSFHHKLPSLIGHLVQLITQVLIIAVLATGTSCHCRPSMGTNPHFLWFLLGVRKTMTITIFNR